MPKQVSKEKKGFLKNSNIKTTLPKLLSLFKPFIFILVIGVILVGVGIFFSLYAPLLVSDIVDEIAISMTLGRPINMGLIGSTGLWLVIFYVLNFLFLGISDCIMAKINKDATYDLRNRIGRKINDVPFKYYDTSETGDILSRITNDVDTVGESLNSSVMTLLRSILMLISVIAVMFAISWQLALTCILTIPITVVLLIVIMNVSQKYFKNSSVILGSLTGHTEETYSGFNVIKLFSKEKDVNNKFAEFNNKLRNTSFMSNFLSGLMMPLMNFIAILAVVLVSIVGGELYIKGLINIGIISSFFIFVRLYQNPLINISMSLNNLQRCLASTERIFEFLDLTPVEDESNKLPYNGEVKGQVSFEHVKFSYNPDRLIIKDLNVEVKPGQTVAIVGPTGAGKTTIINLLMRFYEVDSGDIKIDGKSIRSMKREDVRNMFGMVLQDTWLFEGTIADNLRFNRKEITDEQIVKACQVVSVEHFIQTLPNAYDYFLSEENQISTGQKQLLTIARAVLQNNPMLILDEATSNVDTRTEFLIQKAMDELTIGRTSFVIAHRLSTIKNADLILVLKDGDVVEQGTHNDLLNQAGFYADLYNSQFSEE